MPKLTKTQRRQIEGIIADMESALAYLLQPTTAICRAGTINADVRQGPTEYRQAAPFETKDYSGRDGAQWSIAYVRTLEPVSKESGSSLVRLPSAIRIAREFLATN